MNPKLNSTWWALRIGLGLVPFLAGLDKFFNILTDWSIYLGPVVASLLPVSGEVFMRAVGVIEMAVGLLILVGYTRVGGYIAAAWLVGYRRQPGEHRELPRCGGARPLDRACRVYHGTAQ